MKNNCADVQTLVMRTVTEAAAAAPLCSCQCVCQRSGVLNAKPKSGSRALKNMPFPSQDPSPQDAHCPGVFLRFLVSCIAIALCTASPAITCPTAADLASGRWTSAPLAKCVGSAPRVPEEYSTARDVLLVYVPSGAASISFDGSDASDDVVFLPSTSPQVEHFAMSP